MTGNPVTWFEIYVQDIAQARKFYETVLDIELGDLDGPGDLQMFGFPMHGDAPGASGALVHFKDVPSGGNSTLVYFRCDDCAVEASRVADSGGTLVRDKMSIGQYGFVALAKDTEGNMFGLHSAE